MKIVSTNSIATCLKAGMLLAALAGATISASATPPFFGGGSGVNSASNSTNVGLGFQVFNSITSGGYNSAVGNRALYSNTTGANNCAFGMYTLFTNTSGQYNTATGYSALTANTIGNYNTATGALSMQANSTGQSNSAVGYFALGNNTTGLYNVALGVNALSGNQAGSNNVAIGTSAGNLITGSNNITIGNTGTAADAGVIRIGNTGHIKAFVAGISGVQSSGGVAVYINSSGQLGTITSSRRFKYAINDMGSVSDRLLKLRPVTFRYKAKDENGAHPLQYGLIAEEVASIFPDLVQYDKQGKPFTVFYHLLAPLLLNEFQKEHKQVEIAKASLQAEVIALKATLSKQSKEMVALRQVQGEQQKQLAQLAGYIHNGKPQDARQSITVVQH